MNKEVLNLILEEKVLKDLKKHAIREGIFIEKYVINVLEEFNNVKWRKENYSINR